MKIPFYRKKEYDYYRGILEESAEDFFTTQIVGGKIKLKDGTVKTIYKDVPALKHNLPKVEEAKDRRGEVIDFKYDDTKVVMIDGERVILSKGPRVSLVEKYRQDAQAERDINYDVDDDRLDSNLRLFAQLLNIDLEE
jgi:hypothetical protein